MEFDLDLEDLDLKSVDIRSATPTQNNKNISFQNNNTNSQSAFKPTFREQSPNLTISTNNTDSMPSMNGFNSDKEVDFGLNLLVNKKKQRPESEITKLGSNSSNPSPTNKMSSSFSSMFGNSNGGGNNSSSSSSSNSMPQKVNFDDTELLQSSLFDDNMTNIDLDKELSSMDLEDISPPKPSMSGPSLPNFGSSGSGIGGLGSGGFAASATNTFGGSSMGGSSSSNSFGGGNSYGSINTAGISSTENLSFEEIQKRKFDLLCKFERLRDKGIKLPKTFSMSSNYEEMNHEYERLIHHRKMDNSVKMQRRMLVSFASMAEFVNNKTGNPFDIHLDGWSENMNEEINNYDEVFEDLYEKYKESASMAPELKLVFMVASSAFWFHISNNMSKSVMGNMNMGDMFKNNPNLMNQFKEAAMGSMQQNSPGLANFMSMGQGGQGNSNSGPPKYNPMAGPPFANPRDAPPRGSTNINSSDDIDALIDSISN